MYKIINEHLSETLNACYIDYLAKKYNFKPVRQYFESYQIARNWCFNNLERFNGDTIKFV